MMNKAVFAVAMLAVSVFARCATDGEWSAAESGVTRSVACTGNQWGKMYRTCVDKEWDPIDLQYCMPLYPEKGYAFVDYYYLISNARAARIKSRPEGIKMGLKELYGIDESAITLGYIGVSPGTQNYAVVQVRVHLTKQMANVFYLRIANTAQDTDLAEYFKDNNNDGERFQYLINGNETPDVSYEGNPVLHEPKAKNNMTVVIVIVVIIIVIIVGGIVGFYVWLQVKRHGSRNGSRQLKNTAKV